MSMADVCRYLRVPQAVEAVLQRLPDAPRGVVEVAATHMLGHVEDTEMLLRQHRGLLGEVATRRVRHVAEARCVCWRG